MKKLILSGFGLMMVLMMAMPAAAEKGSRQREENYGSSRHSETYSSKKHGHKTPLREVKEEWRDYKRNLQNNIWALVHADSYREKTKIRSNIRADYRDYKNEVRQFKRDYHHQQDYYRHQPVMKHQHKTDNHYHHSGYHSALGAKHLGFGFRY